MHEIPWRLVFREGGPELLRDPAGGRMGRDVRMNDAPTVMREDDQHEQQPEGDRWHDKEVGGHDLARVVRQKRSPCLGRRPRMPSHVLRDGRQTDDEAQFLQLAVDPRRTPQWVHRRQLADQGSHLGRHPGSSGAAPALPGPEQAEPTSMPADNRVRFDDVQDRPPAAPRPREPRPERPIRRRQSEARTARAIDHRELVTERQDLQVERRP